MKISGQSSSVPLRTDGRTGRTPCLAEGSWKEHFVFRCGAIQSQRWTGGIFMLGHESSCRILDQTKGLKRAKRLKGYSSHNDPPLWGPCWHLLYVFFRTLVAGSCWVTPSSPGLPGGQRRRCLSHRRGSDSQTWRSGNSELF